MGPTLTALLFVGVGSSVAHAQGTMDFSGAATTLMRTFKTFCHLCGCRYLSWRSYFRRNPHDERDDFRTLFLDFSALYSVPECWDGELAG